MILYQGSKFAIQLMHAPSLAIESPGLEDFTNGNILRFPALFYHGSALANLWKGRGRERDRDWSNLFRVFDGDYYHASHCRLGIG